MCLFYKLLSTGQPSRIDYLLPQIRNSHRDPSTFHVFPSTTKCFKSSLFPYAINEWKKLDPNILSFSNYNTFRNALLKFIRPVESKIFNINSFKIKLLTGLRLRFSHLREHKFRNRFKDSLNAFCLCSIDAETTTLFPALLLLRGSVHIRSYSGPHFPAFGLNNSEYGYFFRSMNDLENIPISFARLVITI